MEPDNGPSALEAVRVLIATVGEDPDREGLTDTPGRVVKALTELTAGYSVNPAELLGRTFGEPFDEMVVVSRIPFVSLCEHHLLPFTGHATVGYIPANGRVVGLSKLARLVDAYARRFQIQERLTAQVAQAITDHLDPKGAGVVVSATHSCMTMRGIKAHGATMTTSSLTGAIRDKPEARAEFLAFHEP